MAFQRGTAMKIRNGFVSNSSSSSFVVAFKKLPETVDEMLQMLFGDEKTFTSDYYGNFSAQNVAETVFNDLQRFVSEEKKLDNTNLKDELNGWLDDFPKYPPYSNSGADKENMDKWRKRCDEIREATAAKFLAETEGCTLVKFRYSDNDGDFMAALEHGDIFYKLPHITVNNH